MAAALILSLSLNYKFIFKKLFFIQLIYFYIYYKISFFKLSLWIYLALLNFTCDIPYDSSDIFEVKSNVSFNLFVIELTLSNEESNSESDLASFYNF